jgi:hypothetical protein
MAGATDRERAVGVRVGDMLKLYTQAQTHFRTLPTLTDEQCRSFVCAACPFRFTQVEMYKLLTRRQTSQKQFLDLLAKHKEAADKMLGEAAAEKVRADKMARRQRRRRGNRPERYVTQAPLEKVAP